MSRRGGFRVPSAWKRGVFWSLLGGLVAGNVWLLRKQFPPDQQRRNEAYDRALLAMDPTNPKRSFEVAVAEFRKYLQISDEPRVRELLAIALQGMGKLSEARQEFEAVLARDPDSDRSRVGLAEMAVRDQDYDEAFRQLAAAEAESPTPIEVPVLRGRLLTELGDLDGALAAYRRSLETDASSYESHLSIADILTLRSLLTGSQTDRQGAAGSYREAETILKSRMSGGGDARLRMALARAIAGQSRILKERDLAEAVRQLRAVAEADPKDAAPTLLLGRFLVDAGNDVEARRTFEDAAQRLPGPDTAIALHDFLASKGEVAPAAKVLEDAILRDREDLALRVRLVAFHVRTGNMDAAERELANAETILSNDWRVHEIRGDLAREKAHRALSSGARDDAEKERAAALAAYRRALEGRPRSPRLKKKIAGQLIEGVLARGAGRGEPTDDERFARKCIEDVLRVNGTDAEALEWQARLLLAEGRSREALDLLRPLAAAPQPSVSSLRLLGVSAMRAGDDAAAADALERVLAILAPEDADGRRDARLAPAEDWCAAVAAGIRAGRVDRSARMARAAAAAWPDSPRAAAAVGTSALAQGDVTGAFEALRAARTRFPADGEIRLLFARTLEEGGRIEDAAKEYEAAAAEIATDEARMRYLDFLARTGRMEHAEQGFLQLIAADPSNPAARLRLGDFYLAAKPPRPDAALREFEAARTLDPASPEPVLRIADLRLADAADDPRVLAEVETMTAEYEKLASGDPHSEYLRGKIALASGRADEAVERLRKFTVARPERAAGHYYLAVALRAAGRAADALDPLEKAMRLAPGDGRVKAELAALHFDLGVKAFQAGDFEAARRFFARADAGGSGGSGSMAQFLVAGAAANAGDFEVGEKECRKLLEADPKNRSGQQLLAMLLLRRQERSALDEAEQIYRSILADEPDDILSLLGVGMAKFLKGFPKEALEDFRRAYPRMKSSPDVALAMCQCWSAMGDLRSAVDFLDAEAAANPAAWDFPHMKGDFLVGLKQFDLAVDAFLEASRRAPSNAGPVLGAASALVQSGKLEDARKLLVERQTTTDDPALVAVALGDVLAHLGRVEEAQDSLRRALALKPGHPRALYLLGRISETAGRKAEAKKLYREAVDRGTADPDCRARLARLHAEDGDFAGAREAWIGALRFAPRDPVYLNALAIVTSKDESRLEEALGYARSASLVAPERGEIADTYGWLLYRAGKYEEASVQLARASALLERVAEVQFHAGMALSKIGRAPEARVHLERALLIDPKFDGADAARAEIERLR